MRPSTSPSPAGSAYSASVARVAPFIDPMSLDLNKRISDLEIENARLTSRLVIAEKETALKDQELNRVLMEHRATKSNLEKLIKELIEKNKTIEQDFRRKLKSSEELIQRMSADQQHSNYLSSEAKTAVGEWKSALNAREVEVDHWHRAYNEILRQEEFLQRQLDDANDQLQRMDDEVALARRSEDEAQQELELAVKKLNKADEHIQKLSSEAAENAVEMVRLRHVAEAAEVDSQTARDDKEDLERLFLHLSHTAAVEVDKLTLETEELLQFMKNATQRTENPTYSAAAASHQKLFLISPNKGDGPVDASPVTLMKRLVEAVILAKEDVAVTLRAATEMARLHKDNERRVEILTEALQEERGVAYESVERTTALNDALVQEQSKAARLESSLQQSARWMEEAAALGEESRQRAERLVQEIRDTQTELTAAKDDLQRSVKALRAAEEEKEVLARKVSELQEDLKVISERYRTFEKKVGTAVDEVEDIQAKLRDKEKSVRQLEQVVAKADSERAFFARQSHETEERLRQQARHIENLETANNDIRSKLFDTQKRMDNLLRSSTPTRQAPQGSSGVSPTPMHKASSLFSPDSKARPPLSTQTRGTDLTNAPPVAGSSVSDKAKSWEERINSLLSARSRV